MCIRDRWKFTLLDGFLGPFYQFWAPFWMQNKVSQSGSRTVIVCHFALFTILGSRKHPRITKNLQNFGEFHQNMGEFHLKINEYSHFWVDFWCRLQEPLRVPYSILYRIPYSILYRVPYSIVYRIPYSILYLSLIHI